MRVIISAGGTGGHIYPALAILNKIKERDPQAEFLYIGTHNRMEKDLIPELGIKYLPLEVTGFNRKKIFNNFKTLSLYLKAKNRCKKIIKEFEPDVVIGCGGYVTAPVIKAAFKMKIPTFIHEQNSIVGLSNKFLAKYATKIGVSFESTVNMFPKDKAIYTGNPCSEKAYNIKSASKSEFGLSTNKKLVLIVMGSLGSSSVNDKIVVMLDKFATKDYEVVFVTGNSYYEKIKNIKVKANIKILPFIYEMPRLMKITDVIISRAGASTMSEIMALAIPTIFIPSPYVPNNHQFKNAYDLVSKDAACMLEEKDLTPDNLIKMIDELLNDKDKYMKIKNNLKKLRITDSADKIYKIIKEMVDNNGKLN